MRQPVVGDDTKAALAVMFRLPVAGRVKTRLYSSLTKEQVLTLYELFIEDLFSSLRRIKDRVDVYGFYAPDGGVAVCLPTVVAEVATLLPQKGRGLGERLYELFSRLYGLGYRRIVTIGSDSPDLPLERIERALHLLQSKDCVVGPARDGGYYLIGLRHPVKGLFSHIPWGTSGVLCATLKRARYLSIGVELLDEWYDVDELSGLVEFVKRNGCSLKSSLFAKETVHVL